MQILHVSRIGQKQIFNAGNCASKKITFFWAGRGCSGIAYFLRNFYTILSTHVKRQIWTLCNTEVAHPYSDDSQKWTDGSSYIRNSKLSPGLKQYLSLGDSLPEVPDKQLALQVLIDRPLSKKCGNHVICSSPMCEELRTQAIVAHKTIRLSLMGCHLSLSFHETWKFYQVPLRRTLADDKNKNKTEIAFWFCWSRDKIALAV